MSEPAEVQGQSPAAASTSAQSVARPVSLSYVALARFTDQGRKAIKDSPSRIAKAKALARQMGITIQNLFLLMGGPYELLLVAQAPDDKTFEKFSLAVGMAGNAEGTAMRAFTEDEFRVIVQEIPTMP